MSSKQDDIGIWLPIYIGEMLAMTTRFNTEQIGALYLLMMDYWKNGEVPHDYKVITTITGLSAIKSKAFIKLLLSIQFFESNDEMLFSPYLDAKKQTATSNRKMKSERAKKGSDARWGKTGNNGSDDSKTKNNPSNAQAVSESCISNADDMLEQCPSSLSLSNISSLSQGGNNSLNFETIKDWIAPTLDEINALLKRASVSAPVLDSVAYVNHINKFKTYYIEQELKNNPILTNERRKDVLAAWISNDRQYKPTHDKKKGHSYETTNSGKANAFDNAINYAKQSNDAVDSYFDAMERT